MSNIIYTDGFLEKMFHKLQHIKGDYLALFEKNQSSIAREFFYALAKWRALKTWIEEPRLSNAGLKCKPAVQSDFESEWFQYWWRKISGAASFTYHRKWWEYCYLLQVLWEQNLLSKGRRGLGFACGMEPVPSYLASMEIDVTATDLAQEEGESAAWSATNQHMDSWQSIWKSEIVSENLFKKHCTIEYVDMNRIPSALSGYDFCWSLCAFEHIGSVSKGFDFVENSLNTLRPGGVAVHTSEIQVSKQNDHFETPGLICFKKEHYITLAEKLTRAGHFVAPLDFNFGTGSLDKYADVVLNFTEPTYCHLKYAFAPPYVTTSFGLIIIKKSS